MPSAAVPQSLRDALGPQAAGDLSAWLDESLDESIRQRAITRDEFREVLSRLDVVDERFEQVDDRFDQMEQRFDLRFEAVEGRLGRLESKNRTPPFRAGH
jgi:tetrahydromethanopterin S-methyltransferase subunit G